MIFDNARYLSSLIKRVYWALLLVLAALLGLTIFFAMAWYRSSKNDNVYILSSDLSFAASRTDGSLGRSDYEIRGFANLFLEKAFAHNEYSWDEDMAQASSLMDQESARLFSGNMDEAIEALYKEHNAISSVCLQEIEINREAQPFEVLLYYVTTLRFPCLGEVIFKDTQVEGGVYFQLEAMSRSIKNPYGMQIRKLKFLKRPAK